MEFSPPLKILMSDTKGLVAEQRHLKNLTGLIAKSPTSSSIHLSYSAGREPSRMTIPGTADAMLQVRMHSRKFSVDGEQASSKVLSIQKIRLAEATMAG